MSKLIGENSKTRAKNLANYSHKYILPTTLLRRLRLNLVGVHKQCLPSVQEKLYPRVRTRERRFDAWRRVKQLFDGDRRSRRGLFLSDVLLFWRLFAGCLFGRAVDGVGIIVLSSGYRYGTRPSQRYLKSFGWVSSLAQDFTWTTQTHTSNWTQKWKHHTNNINMSPLDCFFFFWEHELKMYKFEIFTHFKIVQ